jgi:hypothetical protein
MADEPQASPVSINEPLGSSVGGDTGTSDTRVQQPPALPAPPPDQAGGYVWIQGQGWVWQQAAPSPFTPQQQPPY